LALVTTPWNPLATWSEFLGSLLRCIWFLLVWSIFATSITRYVALRLVDEELPGFRDVLRFGVVKWPAAFNSAAFVFLGIVALAVPGGLLGLVMRFDWGLAIIGVVWPLILIWSSYSCNSRDRISCRVATDGCGRECRTWR
jgi:hypothetical protein